MPSAPGIRDTDNDHLKGDFELEKNIRDIEKGSDLVRISLSEFQGRQYVGARIYYMDDRGDWKPTRKGITLTPEMMVQVHEAIGEALAELEES